MEESGIDTRGQAMPSANGDKGDGGEDNTADDEPRALHHVRVDNGAQAAHRSMAFLVSTFITSRLLERKACSPHPKRRSRNSGIV